MINNNNNNQFQNTLQQIEQKIDDLSACLEFLIIIIFGVNLIFFAVVLIIMAKYYH